MGHPILAMWREVREGRTGPGVLLKQGSESEVSPPFISQAPCAAALRVANAAIRRAWPDLEQERGQVYFLSGRKPQ